MGETLRLAGSLVLDMEPDDLLLLMIPQVGEEKVDLILYDPMPGGSGLLKQMIEAWPVLIETANDPVSLAALLYTLARKLVNKAQAEEIRAQFQTEK
ncbi:MAG: DUF1998 domain-containing protein [Verrucomicrobia bacterium]|nr:DUF1998 domain-containing protein [Verrucomicrobiota bacterium]